MANIDLEMGQFKKVTTLENKDYIVVSLDNGTQGQIKVSDLASVVAGVVGTGVVKSIKLSAGNSITLTSNGLYYISATGPAIVNGILLLRTRYTLHILAKTSDPAYDLLNIEAVGATDLKITNIADVEQTVTYRIL